MIKTITKTNFSKEVEQAKIPVLVELWAPWCVHCRRLSPVLDRLEKKLRDAVVIGKINVDEQPELAKDLDASTIPTLYVFKNGTHGEKLVAPKSQAQVESWLGENGAV